MFALTLVHVVISLVGIGSGFVVLYGLWRRNRLPAWTAVFLGSTVATSASGFLFPVDRFLPSHAIGIVSLVVLAIAIYGLYVRRLAGGWRTAYVVAALAAQYFNVLVLVVQSFQKLLALKALAPTLTELPFVAAQALVFTAFVAAGVVAVKRFQPVETAAAVVARP